MTTIIILYPLLNKDKLYDPKTIEINNVALSYGNSVYYHSCIIIYKDARKLEDLKLEYYISYDLALILVPNRQSIISFFEGQRSFEDLKETPLEIVENNNLKQYLLKNKIQFENVLEFRGYVTEESDIKFSNLNIEESDIEGETNLTEGIGLIDKIIAKLRQRDSYTFEKDTIEKLLIPERLVESEPDQLFGKLKEKCSPSNREAFVYLELIKSKLLPNHDFKKGNLVQLVLYDFSNELVLFLQKIVFNNEEAYLLIENPKELEVQAFEVLELQNILIDSDLTPKPRMETMIKDKNGVEMRYAEFIESLQDTTPRTILKKLKDHQDSINLINIAYRGDKGSKPRNDFSRTIITSDFLTYAVKIYGINKTERKFGTFFVQSNNNMLFIKQYFLEIAKKESSFIHIFNLKTIAKDDFEMLYNQIVPELKATVKKEG